MEYKTLCTFLGKNYKANLINDSVLLRLCVHFWKKIINDSVSNQRLGWHLGKKIINDPGPLFDTLEYLYDSCGLGVDDPLRASRKPVDLTLGVASGGDGRDLLDRGNVAPTAVLEGLAQIVQANLEKGVYI